MLTTTCRPFLYTYEARLETTDWWPADTGDNSYWLGEFTDWAFEDPNNNRIATPFDIIYSEPDLKVTNITVPANVVVGRDDPDHLHGDQPRDPRRTRTDELDRRASSCREDPRSTSTTPAARRR